MTLGLAFWILMLVSLIGGIYLGWTGWPGQPHVWGGNLLLFILLLLLGWAVFGAPLRG